MGAPVHSVRLRLKCDGTRAETRFRLSAKRTSPFKSAGVSVQLNTGSRGVRISGSNSGYTMFRGSVKGTAYPLHSPVSPSLPLPCVTVCHHISTGLYCLSPSVGYSRKLFALCPSRLTQQESVLNFWYPKIRTLCKFLVTSTPVSWAQPKLSSKQSLHFRQCFLQRNHNTCSEFGTSVAIFHYCDAAHFRLLTQPTKH